MNKNKKTPRDWLAECRKILGTDDRQATYWDAKMTSSDKRVILTAANLPTDSHHIKMQFRSWTVADQKRIKEAAKRASNWAASLGVA